MSDVAGPRTSRAVTIEDAAQYDATDPARALEVAGDQARAHSRGYYITAANGKLLRLEHGQQVIRYAPGDVGVMDDGEYERWFG